jgi:hypothetical protein
MTSSRWQLCSRLIGVFCTGKLLALHEVGRRAEVFVAFLMKILKKHLRP